MLEILLWIILVVFLVFVVICGYLFWKIKKIFSIEFLIYKLTQTLINETKNNANKSKKNIKE